MVSNKHLAWIIYFSIILLVASAYIFISKLIYTNNPSQKKNIFKIALLTPINTNFHGEVSRGFIEEAKKDSIYEWRIDKFLTQGPDKLLMSNIAQKVASYNSPYAALVSVGGMYSQVATNTLIKKKSDKLLISIGTANPHNIIKSRPENTIGIEEKLFSHISAAQLFLLAKKELKRVLIPYYTKGKSGKLEYEAHEIAKFFQEKNIEVTLLPIDHINQSLEKIKAVIKRHDGMMILGGCILVDAIEGIIKICNRNSITLFAPGIDAIKSGAAIGTMPDTPEMGRTAFRVLRKILSNKKPNNFTSYIKELNDTTRLGINLKAAKKQNLSFSQEVNFLLTKTDVFP